MYWRGETVFHPEKPSPMKQDIYNASLLSLLFIQLFIIAEILHRKFSVKPGFTRKLIYTGTGILTLLFPFTLHTVVAVFILCFVFGVILYITIRAQLLQSMTGLDPNSAGSLLFPASVFICFAFYKLNNNILCFYLPVLTLAICDPIAALIGRKWPIGSFIIRYSHKTLSGSFAFFLAALCISGFLLYNMTDLPPVLIFRKALLLASLTSVAEAVSTRGFDNLTIPATVLLCLKIQM
jgi:phytol kinase